MLYKCFVRPHFEYANLVWSFVRSFVERDTLSGRGSRLSPGASAYQKLFLPINACAHDEQGINPGQEKESSMVSSMNCDRC